MRHYVTLLFDVEDLCWPGSDDIPVDLAAILTRNQVRGTFFVVGEKARLWQSRGRTDVIAALAPHDVGLHTDLHSIHPTVSEYLAPCDWHDGVDEAIQRDAPGFESIERIFGRQATSWGQARGTWGPQIHAALSRVGVPCAVYPATYTASSDVHWYAGALTFSGNDMVFFDSEMLDARRFEGRMTAMYELLDRRISAGQTWTGIFVCHPTMLRDQPTLLNRSEVYGPITEPPDTAQPSISWNHLVAACQALIGYVEANSHLPTHVGTAAEPIGIGTFGRALASALLQRSRGDQPAYLPLQAGRQIPAIAEAIADRVRSGIAHWPIHDPHIDTERLLLHTRLQCWTLRPAIPTAVV